MSKKLAKLLQADDMSALAQVLQSKGRKGDTMLAHINPREAALLRASGGSGSINPETGLFEFFDGESIDTYAPPADYSAHQAPSELSHEAVSQQTTQPTSFPEYNNAGYTGAGSVFDPSATSGTAPQQQPVSFFDTGMQQGRYGSQQLQGADLANTSTGDVYSAATQQGALTQPSPITQPTGDDQSKQKSFLDSLTNTDKMRLGLAGGLGLFGAYNTRKAAGQAKAAQAEQAAIGKPYQEQGQELIRSSQAGELSPANAQAYQALQARLAQGVESRGGVGSQQAAGQVEAFRQQLLQNQYNYGLQVSQIGDNIALGAIKTGLQLDQQLNQANMAFYTSLASIAAGVPTRTTQVTA